MRDGGQPDDLWNSGQRHRRRKSLLAVPCRRRLISCFFTSPT